MKIHLNIFILLSVFVLALHLSGRESPPNVVLIMVDDYGYADIGFEGNEKVHTPNIDSIAKDGIHFTRFYQCAGACAPTRASLLTGRYFYETGVWGVHWGRDFIHRDEKTLGDLMQNAGYKTGVFGKWHSGKTNAFFGWNRGFDTSVHTKLYDYWDSMVIKDNRIISVEGPMTDVVGDEAVRFIEDNKNRPFFCYIPFQAIHEPFNAREELFEKYKARGHSTHVARLYGMIETLDDNVGKVLNKLDELNLAEDTLVMFLVDDGSSPGFDLSYSNRRMNKEERAERERAWGRKLRGNKANIWEGGQISPFYVRWPGKIPAGESSEVLSGVIDIYPTLAAICEAEYPEGQLPLRGVNLLPSLIGEGQDLKERRYFDGTNLYLKEKAATFVDGVPRIPWLSVHYQNYKYVRQDAYAHQGKDEVYHYLFDLKKDPREQHNLADDLPELTRQLQQETEAWFQKMVDGCRAFGEVTYPVGCWNERGTPINLDSFVELKGTLERDKGPGFFFNKWDKVGNELVYSIEVLAEGEYEIELEHKNPVEGCEMTIRADRTSVSGVLSNGKYSVIEGLKLFKGKQLLHLTLTDLKGAPKAMDDLVLMTVRRVPEKDDPVPETLGFVLSFEDADVPSQTVYRRDEAREFMFPKANEAVELTLGETVEIQPIVSDPDDLAGLEVYLGFEEVGDFCFSETPISVRPSETGLQTLNVVFVTKCGIRNSARIDLKVK